MTMKGVFGAASVFVMAAACALFAVEARAQGTVKMPLEKAETLDRLMPMATARASPQVLRVLVAVARIVPAFCTAATMVPLPWIVPLPELASANWQQNEKSSGPSCCKSTSTPKPKSNA